MKRIHILLSFSALSAVMIVGVLALSPRRAQAQGGGNPAAQEAAAAQAKLEDTYPKLNITDQYLRLAVPGQTVGQTTGVATDSKGNLFVYSRSVNQGIARGGKAAILWEFDSNYKFVKEWGPNNYAESFAHAVRVDKNDNVWQVDEGSGMIVKYDPTGQSILWLGRTPEAIDYLQGNLEILKYAPPAAGLPANPGKPVGGMGSFNRETDVAFDSTGNIFVSDGYGNSRAVKISPEGHWLKTVGTNGKGQDQFSTPHGIAVDAQNNVYVADRGNRRIQVYDDNLTYERTISGIGAAWSVCITKTTPQILFSGDGNGKLYKMDLTGKVLGMAATGLDHGQTGDLIHALDCRTPDTVYIGSASMWDVQKLTIKSGS
jgi:DNA-binding beta-propeller fold protein YncE